MYKVYGMGGVFVGIFDLLADARLMLSRQRVGWIASSGMIIEKKLG